MAREVNISGYSQLIFKSDQEPAIRELIAAVRRERPVGVEIMIEESPVGEHQSNGEVERAIQSVQEMMRTMKLALQSRYKSRIRSDHPILPWLVTHAAMILNLCKVGKDGRTAHERRKGKRFLRALPESYNFKWAKMFRKSPYENWWRVGSGTVITIVFSKREQPKSPQKPTSVRIGGGRVC